VFWYLSKCPVLFEKMVQIKQKSGHGVKNPPPRSFWCDFVKYIFVYVAVCVKRVLSTNVSVYVAVRVEEVLSATFLYM